MPKKAYFIKQTWIAKSLTACIFDVPWDKTSYSTYLTVLINVSDISGWQERGSMNSIHQAKLQTTNYPFYFIQVKSDGYLFAGVYKLHGYWLLSSLSGRGGELGGGRGIKNAAIRRPRLRFQIMGRRGSGQSTRPKREIPVNNLVFGVFRVCVSENTVK